MGDYNNYIVNSDFSGNSIQTNMSKITEYDNALNGKPSTLLNVSSPSLGKIYFSNTGEPCKKDVDQFKKYISDMSNISVSPTVSLTFNEKTLPFSTYSSYLIDSEVPTRFSFIDAYKIRDISGETGIYASASTDLAAAASADPTITSSNADLNSCVPVTLKVMEADGSRKFETQFVTVADIDSISNDLYLTNANGVPMKPIKENIVIPVVEGFIDTSQMFDEMDVGQKIFVSSLGVLGLYFFFKLLYKPLTR
jgi:hypothetical protein